MHICTCRQINGCEYVHKVCIRIPYMPPIGATGLLVKPQACNCLLNFNLPKLDLHLPGQQVEDKRVVDKVFRILGIDDL